jgi:hypothetical protein
MIPGIFEAIMLICFGIAWPFSIHRSYTSRSTNGKSLVFLVIVIIGYIAGITNKILTGVDYVIYLYILNTIMVTIDSLLYIRNKRYEKDASEQ